MLEEYTDDIPLIEYEYGKDGKHFLVSSSKYDASKYLPKLRAKYDNDFKFVIPAEQWDED